MDHAEPTRQARKRLATRQSISDAATALFFVHGFDNVTVDQIAEAADVSRMTVFNHFARKEDMFFDQEENMRSDLAELFAALKPEASAIEALRHFLHRAFGPQGKYRGALDLEGHKFMQTIHGNEALSRRWHTMHTEWSGMLASALVSGLSSPKKEPEAQLAAAIMLTSWSTALNEAHKEFRRSQNTASARRVLFRLIDQGAAAAESVMPEA